MKHSNQVREFMISNEGLDLVDVYLGPEGVLTGSARMAQQMQEQAGVELKKYAVTRKDREIERKKTVLESKIASLKKNLNRFRTSSTGLILRNSLEKMLSRRTGNK